MEYQRLDNTPWGSYKSVPCQDTIRCNALTAYAHNETKDEQQSEYQTAKTGLMNTIEQADTSRDTDSRWDHIETGKPHHFTCQQTSPPVVHDDDRLIDEKKRLATWPSSRVDSTLAPRHRKSLGDL